MIRFEVDRFTKTGPTIVEADAVALGLPRPAPNAIEIAERLPDGTEIVRRLFLVCDLSTAAVFSGTGGSGIDFAMIHRKRAAGCARCAAPAAVVS